ncbi:chromosomal replication initiator protein DnaA [bacterium]|nr:chromosomal replication initiator protein DnaA [bacterium]MBT4121924.1 chromosomal replication initiator protein DnaA [bacterium]MBT4335183.1 chromosomal replication initiator protein DnaA [bacterium]MBT4495424.1 chromosomal replication initiator protein DnaA [bacterium]MBT4763649.1 chromosomal replication initiator protein DnaA [bacterium]
MRHIYYTQFINSLCTICSLLGIFCKSKFYAIILFTLKQIKTKTIMTNDQLWQAVLGELELLISKANFTTWFKNTFISSSEDNKVIVGTPNAFTKAWLEKKYKEQILQALKNITSKDVKLLEFVVETSKPQVIKPKLDGITPRVEVDSNNTSSEKRTSNKFGFNEKYNFESFVIGKGNELASAAAKAVAEKPGISYNPLFIYGGVGLGKTHLAQAIGNHLLLNNPKLKILFISSEKFTNDFIQSIKTNTVDQFKNIYRKVDVLIIDDIQFISGKEQTQEEFFHTFNALHQDNKQIVLSSDRPPKAIPDIEQRLISRFEWGMTADISAPDLETRIAILEAKANEKEHEIEKEVIQYLAENVRNNVRELEGALNRIIGHHQLNNSNITLDSTKQIMENISASNVRGNITPKKIIQIVSSYFDISIEEITGNCRRRQLVTPRQIVMYLMREEIKASYPSIGQELGGRDHTTAIHACNKITAILEKDEKMKNDIHLIKQKFYQ